ncbi:MAG TPA: division/cell wall cluster transcriptional repressor MraZ [Candidatus Polarisedimenticolia bacterium]|nr:division/cell wall cluster transcriptional repressor MraZ [Candidatus Polarisedimenticolia bacterium]
MLRGSSHAKVDEKGRLKIPSLFKGYLEESYGREFFLTSYNAEFARLYPMPVWVEKEKVLVSKSSLAPEVARFRSTVNYYGQPVTMDDQGRVLIHPPLRDKTGTNGNVIIIGNLDCLDIWNREKYESQMTHLTDNDLRVLADYGI